MSVWDSILFAWAVIFFGTTIKETAKLIAGTRGAAKREDDLRKELAATFDALLKAREYIRVMQDQQAAYRFAFASQYAEQRQRQANESFRQSSASSQRNMQEPAWCRTLGVSFPATKDQINAAYRAKAMAAHPDKGGSTAAMTELNKARRDALASIN